MNRVAIVLSLASVFGALAAAPVAANEELAKKSNCFACHQVDKKLVGPAYKEIAAKYKGDANAAATLAGKIKAGGTGVWGNIPMPPNAAVSDADIKTLVDWILAM